MSSGIFSKSEEFLSKKWDACLADTALKLGSGVLVGLVTSVVLFKRRSWPVILGTGFGAGLGYGNCQHSLQEPYMVHVTRVKGLQPSAVIDEAVVSSKPVIVEEVTPVTTT